MDFRIQEQSSQNKTIECDWLEVLCIKSRIIQTKTRGLLICKAIIRMIPSAKDRFMIWETWWNAWSCARSLTKSSVHIVWSIWPKAWSTALVVHVWFQHNYPKGEHGKTRRTDHPLLLLLLTRNTPWCSPRKKRGTQRVPPSEGLLKKSKREQLQLNPPAVPTERHVQRFAASRRMDRRSLQSPWQDCTRGPFLHRYLGRKAEVWEQLETGLERSLKDPRLRTKRDGQKADPPIPPSQQIRQRPVLGKPVAIEFMVFISFFFDDWRGSSTWRVFLELCRILSANLWLFQGFRLQAIAILL